MKRLLALLLSLVMALSLIPAAAAEDIEIIDPEQEPVGVGALDDLSDEGLIELVEPEESAIVPDDEIMASVVTITTPPKSVTAYVGTTVKFSVEATGAESYQWYYRTSSAGYWNKCTTADATTDTVSVVAKSFRNGYQYRCKVIGDSYEKTTAAATLTVSEKPVITTQPESLCIAAGDNARFTVKAEGASGYRWYWREDELDNWHKSTVSTATTDTLVYKNLSSSKSGRQYICKISNDVGYVYSSVVSLTIQKKPIITAQPESLTIGSGGTATFSVKAGEATGYQWYWRANKDDSWHKSTVTTAVTETLVYNNLSCSKSGRQYKCKVSGPEGYTYSTVATLTVLGTPIITAQPTSLKIERGGTATFTVEAEGATAYQWYWRANKDDSWHKSTVSTATQATLEYLNLSYGKSGRQYKCKVSNAENYVYSDVVTLTVAPIQTQPRDVLTKVGASASFSVSADKATSFRWYWRADENDGWHTCEEAGAATDTLELPLLDSGYDGRQYRCSVSDGSIHEDSEIATLNVISGPESCMVSTGRVTYFSIKCKNENLSYQWQFLKKGASNWRNSTLSSGNSSTLSFVSYREYSGNRYRCVVTGDSGSVVSDEAMLGVDYKLGPDVTWIVHENGHLIVEGSGYLYSSSIGGDPDHVCFENPVIPIVEVTIGVGIDEIGWYTFIACDQVKIVHIPLSMRKIPEGSFNSKCLTDVYYAGTKEQWAQIIFDERYNPFSKATIHYNA